MFRRQAAGMRPGLDLGVMSYTCRRRSLPEAGQLAATLSCRTCPVRSTIGAAQARVLCTRRLAAAPVLLASGFTAAASGCTLAAAWRARSRALLAGLSASSLLEMRDIETSASVLW